MGAARTSCESVVLGDSMCSTRPDSVSTSVYIVPLLPAPLTCRPTDYHPFDPASARRTEARLVHPELLRWDFGEEWLREER